MNYKWKLLGAVSLFCAGFLTVQVHGKTQEEFLVTLAGAPGTGWEDGLYEDALFGEQEGIAVKEGALAIADTSNNLIRIMGDGRVVTQAGSVAGRDSLGYAWSGYRDSAKEISYFNGPADCDFYRGWNIVVADTKNHAVRVIGTSWVYTIGGQGKPGYGEAQAGYEALFSGPGGVAVGGEGTVYVADTGNHCIRTINSRGATALLAGIPEEGGFRDGSVSEAMFLEPGRLAVAEDGAVYVCDTGNQKIRKIQNGRVTTLSGGSGGTYLDTEYRIPGYRDGAGEQALFRFPRGICVAGDAVIVADTGNHVIRAIAPDGTTETIAGNGEAGFADGKPLEAMLCFPEDVAWENGRLYISDRGNSAVRTMAFDPDAWLESLEKPEAAE